MRIAIVYHTVDGQAERVADAIADTARADSVEVELFQADAPPTSLEPFGAIVVGGSVHGDRFGKELIEFIEMFRDDLQAKPTAFFSVSLTAARHDEASQQTAHAVVENLSMKTGWRPDLVGFFGGAFAYTRYGFVKRQLVRLMARTMHEATDTSQDVEFTDWAAVAEFAHDLVAHARDAATRVPAGT
jgi:menaquinone-dependent protoporphyrinogen oxidase